MEKEFQTTAVPRQSIKRSSKAFLILIPTLWLIYSIFGLKQLPSLIIAKPSSASIAQLEEFSWTQIKPTTYLNYTPCFGKFQCARLDVPMDYNFTSKDGSRVTIAIVRLPAPVSVIDPRYGGVILTNPGGPGGSGVTHALNHAAEIAGIVNPSSSPSAESKGKYFDVLSWDPRGVNNTTPTVKCFHDSTSYDVWRYQEESEGIGSEEALIKAWARSQAEYSQCSDTDEIVRHMNTPPVVADMVEIIERHAEWRSKEAEAWLLSKEGQSTTKGVDSGSVYSKESVIERLRWRKGEEKLLYWGFSYGSVLGATFAALQPHRSERVILDGIEDTTDYYSTSWSENLKDTDAIMDKFYEYCATAGPEKCALNSGTSDPADIQKSVESLVSDLKENPLAVPPSHSRGPEIITYSDVMQLIFNSLYKPLLAFPQMADLIADVKDNGSAFADFKQKKHEPSCPLQCGSEAKSSSCFPKSALAGEVGIACSDGSAIPDSSKQSFLKYAAALYSDSKWMGEGWASILLKCYHWKAEAAWKIKVEEVKGNTSHPILWIGNTLDPVTPLRNAHIMAKKFPGSVVLTQESEGHCSGSSPSLCTGKYVREFFQTGALPAEGVVCQPEELPLLGNVGDARLLSAEDERLLDAMKRIARNMKFSRGLGFH